MNIAGVDIFPFAAATVLGLTVGYLVAHLVRRLRAPRIVDLGQVDQDSVQALTHRLEALESMQLQRDLQWHETRDQISRHLKRIAAIDQRRRMAGDDPDQDDTLDLIKAKFGR